MLDGLGESKFRQRLAEPGFDGVTERRAVEAGGIGIGLERLALHEQALAGVDRVKGFRFVFQRGDFWLDLEQLGDEAVQMRAEGDDQIGFLAAGQAV
ncbi:MAG TPA: hypothetical protein VHY76_03660, partial [Acetobacteraceae bacterium]|nr:hypothetical protein [Acetobacteraceae bacterium]